MFLSMIIPVYNAEKYLAECLDSCLAQDLPLADYEIICVNDGSKDGSPDILRSFETRHSNITVIDQPNGGVSAARNAGLRIAKGEFVWFIDSDDFIEQNCLHHLKQLVYQNACDCVLLSGYSFGQELTPDEQKLRAARSLVPNITFSALWMRIFRRDLLSDLSFADDISYGEDVLFIRQFCLTDHKSISVDDILYFYRSNPDSLMNSSDRNRQRIHSNMRGAIEMRKVYSAPGGACEANANILINFLNNALILITQSEQPDAVSALNTLKKEKLFPFKKPTECTTTNAYTCTRTDLIGKLYNFMCINAHTYYGYYMLKLWNKLRKTIKGDRHV